MLSNQQLFSELCQLIPGGVNSPFRAFGAVGGTPPVLKRGLGSRVWDVEGKEYIDFCCAWGPLMLGHCHPLINEAIQAALQDGTVFGASTPWELELAKAIGSAYPSIEQVRLVNSGAEAVASALRVARGGTHRPRILKFEGCYHGHVECLDSVGLEADELGGALVLGASPGSAAETLVCEFNDLEQVAAQLHRYRGEVAAVLVEPIPGSMGVVQPEAGFLEGLRTLCDQHGCLLIFDEVLSGCRVSRGGAQQLFSVVPDLTCLGKALAGGMPVGAYGGKSQWMQNVAPVGPIYQAGTFCGNPMTVRSAIANLRALAEPGIYRELARRTELLASGLTGLDEQLQIIAYPGMFGLYFCPEPIRNHHQLERVDQQRYARLYHYLLEQGFYLPPSSLDAAGLSTVHSDADIVAFTSAVAEGLSSL